MSERGHWYGLVESGEYRMVAEDGQEHEYLRQEWQMSGPCECLDSFPLSTAGMAS